MRFARLLRIWRKRHRFEGEMRAEMEFHFEEEVRHLMAEGMDRAAAEHRARVEFGGLAQVQEEARRAVWLHIPEGLAQDCAFAIRTLARHPLFSACTILVLTLGISTNTLIYSLTDSVLLRPLPFPDPDLLVAAWEHHPVIGRQPVALPDFHDWQMRCRSFSELAAYSVEGEWKPLWTGNGHSQPLAALRGIYSRCLERSR